MTKSHDTRTSELSSEISPVTISGLEQWADAHNNRAQTMGTGYDDSVTTDPGRHNDRKQTDWAIILFAEN